MVRRAFIVVMLAACISGCGSSANPSVSTVVRPPTTPQSVKLYSEAPWKYEIIGDVEVTERVQWGRDFALNTIIDGLKAKAAQRGANGLLLTLDPKENPSHYIVAGGYYNETFYQIPIRMKPSRAAVAKAIYVTKEN